MNKKNVEVVCNILGDLIKIAVPIIIGALMSNCNTDKNEIADATNN